MVGVRGAPADPRAARCRHPGRSVMAGKPPDKPKGVKPFLGEDDLLGELDAWDATFDALHGGPEAAVMQEPPMAWPEPTPEPARAPSIPPARADDFAPVVRDSEEALTLDVSLEGEGADTFDTYDR